jgi:hypothetical protein
MGNKFIDLGTSIGTTALTGQSVGDLEDMYVTMDGTFSATTTATVEISFDGGTTWEQYGSSSSAAKALVGPLPRCHLVRGKNSARTSPGTVTYRLCGKRVRATQLLSGERICGLLTDIFNDGATSNVSSGNADVAQGGPATLWLKSTNFVGTYQVEVSFDGGTTWGVYGAPVVITNTSVDSLVTCPRASAVRVMATTYTSGTLSVRYGATREPVV